MKEFENEISPYFSHLHTVFTLWAPNPHFCLEKLLIELIKTFATVLNEIQLDSNSFQLSGFQAI